MHGIGGDEEEESAGLGWVFYLGSRWTPAGPGMQQFVRGEGGGGGRIYLSSVLVS